MIVEDPSGTSWRVKRRWLPWRLRRRRDVDLDVPVLDADDLVAALVIFVVVVVVVVFFPVILVLAVFVAELFLLLLLLPIFVLLRALFVARWPLEAWSGDVLVHAEAVRGWGDSVRRMHEIGDEIRRGNLQAPGESQAE